jgi:hypothetical protein
MWELLLQKIMVGIKNFLTVCDPLRHQVEGQVSSDDIAKKGGCGCVQSLRFSSSAMFDHTFTFIVHHIKS